MESNGNAIFDALARYFSMHTYEVGCREQELVEIYALRYQTYCLECGFLPPAEYPAGLERDEFDARSAHFAAHNVDGAVVGTARLVLSAQDEPFPFVRHCPVFDDVALPPPEQTAEVSRLAVKKDYRRRTGDTWFGVNTANGNGEAAAADAARERRTNAPVVVLGLYRQMYRYSREKGIRYWYAAMERPLARALARFDFIFVPIGAEHDYYGPVTPYLADLKEIEDRLKVTKPELLDWFQYGP